jgi:hypothetical protein
MEWRGAGYQNLRKAALFWESVDPPRTRHARDAYETGTSHVIAWGKVRPLVLRMLMTPASANGSNGGWFEPEVQHSPSRPLAPLAVAVLLPCRPGHPQGGLDPERTLPSLPVPELPRHTSHLGFPSALGFRICLARWPWARRRAAGALKESRETASAALAPDSIARVSGRRTGRLLVVARSAGAEPGRADSRGCPALRCGAGPHQGQRLAGEPKRGQKRMALK